MTEKRTGRERAPDDFVDEAGMESFPASDPPSYWGRNSSDGAPTRPPDTSSEEADDPSPDASTE